MARTILLLCLLAAASAMANPPAPAFTIYGSLRTEDGRPLDTGEGVIILSTSVGEIARGPSDTTLGRAINYTLQLPMDSGITTDIYKDNALAPDLPFTIRVIIGTKTYVPIAVAGRILDSGQPADRERFDLVLGLDSDSDGLPDSWEQGLIDGNPRDGLLNLSHVTPVGNADGDSLTNHEEFITGTYGLDASTGMFLDVIGLANGLAHLQFTAVRGRTYGIRSSIDLKTWVDRPISLNADGSDPGEYYRADDSEVVDVYVPVDATKPGNFYKLDVE